MIKVLQTLNFKKVVKKLHFNEKKVLDTAVQNIIKNPFIGEQKCGDLNNVFVYKFKINSRLTLLAYTYDNITQLLHIWFFPYNNHTYNIPWQIVY